ncbi:hypothetical protein NUU61_008887 [Penicillium alfredii]|uniref:COP9 signalosome complex subunit 3 N-terminal helical repeats domain-containing protein n=1 Tax=Penicillium alfredii TaxID=1506179 RepID=A0A9W9ELZ2_9EURO|nr:uncharacterized protein NUU61_008887 [Penicillium alfredii]KAJ5084308.1 hypothetical protein NUU61_008887 [Penicillium alfredii]
MTLISDLVSASAHLHSTTDLSDEDHDHRIRDCVAYFRQLSSTKALSSVADDETLLDHFDPSADSIAYLFILRVQIQTSQERTSEKLPTNLRPMGKLWSRAVRFLKKFDNIHIRYAGQEWRQLIEVVAQDHLRYFLYGAMVYMALKQWRKSSHFLEVVISMPTTSVVSMVMVEAYKKWVLVGLLEKGKLCSPPGITSPHVVKMYQSLARPYITLAHTFERGDMSRLRAEVDAAGEVWCMDNNLGLVSQVVNAFYRHTVVRLGRTFAALTVADLAKQALPPSTSKEVAESTIASLIMSGALNATLLHPPNHVGPTMLRFTAMPSFPRLSDEVDMQVQLKGEQQSLETLMGHLVESNHHLGLSDEYVEYVHKGQGWVNSGDVNLTEEDGFDMDEDIMGDP